MPKEKEKLRLIDDEPLNYSKLLIIILNILPKALRRIFKREWDIRHSSKTNGVWHNSVENFKLFERIQNPTKAPSNPKLQQRNRKINEMLQTKDIEKWDMANLLCALLESEPFYSKVDPPWFKHVETLRDNRNEIVHREVFASQIEEFERVVEDIQTALSSLGDCDDYIREVDDVKSRDRPVTEEEYKELKEKKQKLDKTELHYFPADVVLDDFVGRKEEITKILDNILKTETKITSITGPASSGKTFLALKVGYTLREQHKYNVVYIDLTGSGSDEEMAMKIEERCNISTSSPFDIPAFKRNITKHVPENTILILDNIGEGLTAPWKSKVKTLMKTLHEAKNNIQLLCTSREKFDILWANKENIDL